MEKSTFNICIETLMNVGLSKEDAYKALRDIRRMARERVKKSRSH